jgi:hypothetical protein
MCYELVHTGLAEQYLATTSKQMEKWSGGKTGLVICYMENVLYNEETLHPFCFHKWRLLKTENW